MRTEPTIALEVKIHWTLANAVASGRDRNDSLPGTVQQWGHHHNRQTVVTAQCEWHLRTDKARGVHVQGARRVLLKFSP
jgi:hypothetical protein